MQKIQFTIFIYIIAFQSLFAQVGINTDQPSATLDIISGGNVATTKALEVNENSNTEIMTVSDNGNIYFKRSLLVNNNAGAAGRLLKSRGINQPPVWVENSTDNFIDKFVAVAFNGNQNIIPSSFYTASSNQRLNIEHFNLNATNIGTWNSSLKEYTVILEGVYHITAGVNMFTQTGNTSRTGNLWIYAGSQRQGLGAVLNPDNNTDLSAAGVLTAYLYPGDKIYATCNVSNVWKVRSNFLNISYSKNIQ